MVREKIIIWRQSFLDQYLYPDLLLLQTLSFHVLSFFAPDKLN